MVAALFAWGGFVGVAFGGQHKPLAFGYQGISGGFWWRSFGPGGSFGIG